MKNKVYIVLALLSALLAGCSEYAPYKTKNVSLDIQILDVSAGYANISITPSKNTFYYAGLMELDSNQAVPAQDDYNFMYLQLDQANIDYLEWRHDLLKDDVPYIASFVDHVLYYGNVEHTIVHLVPGRSYLVYAFVVDPETVKPVGNMYCKSFTTTDSSYKKINFDYRIDGWWDFVYPLDSTGLVNSCHPYMVYTVSQDSLLADFDNDTVKEYHKPYVYIGLRLATYNYVTTAYEENRIEYGVYSASHEYAEYAPDSVVFEPGKTYYTGIFSADGMLNHKQFQIYKFTWQPGMKQTFSHLKDDVGIHW